MNEPVHRRAASVLMVALAVLAVALAIVSIASVNRRAVTIPALKSYGDQQACFNTTFARFDAAVLRIVLAEPRSPAQAEAIAAVRPLEVELDTVNERCVLPNQVEDP